MLGMVGMMVCVWTIVILIPTPLKHLWNNGIIIHGSYLRRCNDISFFPPQLPPPYEQALRYPAALSGTGAGSELSARQSLPDMLQASPTFQPHRNTSV